MFYSTIGDLNSGNGSILDGACVISENTTNDVNVCNELILNNSTLYLNPHILMCTPYADTRIGYGSAKSNATSSLC